jgi:hypothetical protein
MPSPCWLGWRRSKQHGPGLITGPRRLVINQWRHKRVLAEQWREARVECKGSIESWFARFVPKLAEDSSKLRVHFLTIDFVKFGGSLEYRNSRGSWSTDEKSRLGNKLVSAVNQDVLQSSWLFGHYLLVVGVRLFENRECITNNRISREKERDSPCNNRISKLDDVVGGRDAARKHCRSMQQTIVFLEGAAAEHFIRYARVCVRNNAKIRSKTAVKGQFAAQLT